MKAAEQHRSNEAQSLHLDPLTTLSWSALDAWNQRPNEKAAATSIPFTAEEHYRMIDLAAQRQASRRHVTPESILWDWLDAAAEVKSH